MVAKGAATFGGARQFDSAESQTYLPDASARFIEIDYGTGHVAGALASDVVSVAGLLAEGQEFAEVVTGGVAEGFAADGA